MYRVNSYKNFIVITDDEMSTVLNTLTSELFLSTNSPESLLKELDEVGTQDTPRTVPQFIDCSDYPVEGVTVCAAETCNMNCKYCFANAGTYGNGGNAVMTQEDFSRLKEKLWLLNPKGVESIHFFGGEPLLAYAEIFTFCKQLLDECGEKKIKPPHFSLTTNGTLITRPIAKKIREYNIAVCVSLDGPEEIHDHSRVFKNGAGTFRKALRGIQALQAEKLDVAVEATVAVENFLTYDKTKLYQYFDFFATIGVAGVAFFLDVNEKKVDEAAQGTIKHFYYALADYYFDILQDEKKSREIVFTNVLSVVLRILGNKKANTCLAGLTQIFTSVSGDIYPCQTYFAAKHSKMGNISNIESYRQERQCLAGRMNKRSLQSCMDCNYYHFCENKCPGSNLLSTGTEGQPAFFQCFGARCLIDRVIYNLGLIGRDSIKHKRFMENLTYAANLAESFSA